MAFITELGCWAKGILMDIGSISVQNAAPRIFGSSKHLKTFDCLCVKHSQTMMEAQILLNKKNTFRKIIMSTSLL